MIKFKSSEITPEKIFNNRRSFIKQLGIAGTTFFTSSSLVFGSNTNEKNLGNLTTYEYVTTYNNYYEFGTGKSDPYKNAQKFITKPWDISIEGEVENKISLSVDEIKNMFPIEERIYKLRCVEGWSMVIPWLGFPLNKLLDKALPTSKAKFVKFTSVLDPEQMKGQRYPILDWPYEEGLKIGRAHV